MRENVITSQEELVTRTLSTMTNEDSAAKDLERSSERWLAWLAAEVAPRRQDPPERALYALWDALEEWFASDDFADSPLAAAVVAPPDGRGPAAHAVLVRHRQATRRLLEELARSAGAGDPDALAGQLLTLVEGAMAGALIDRHPQVARHARELTRIAIAGS
jgi:hypothetical protein